MDSKISDWRPGPTVCRCCLSEGCYKDISTEYFWMGKTEVYADMLSETFNLSISYSQSGGPNSNSRLICEPCISRLRDASEFKRQVQECEKTFINHLDSGAIGEPSTASMEIEAPTLDVVKGVKLEEVKLEKQYSDDEFDCRDFGDEDDDDDLDDQPLTTFATKVPKKESVDLLDLLDNTQITVKRKSKTKDPEQSKKPKLVRKATATVKAKASVSAKKVEVKPVEKKKKGSYIPSEKESLNGETNIEDDKKRHDDFKAKQQRAIILLEYSRICPFRWTKNMYICIYCEQNYTDPERLRQHNTAEHDSVKYTEIKSAIAKLKKYELVKVDITNVDCKICKKHIQNFNDLKTHLIQDHDKGIDTKEGDAVLPFKVTLSQFQCGVCGDSYAEFKTLNHHMNVHFQNFICDQCGVGFVTSERLRTHAFSHEIGCYPCDNCDKVFRSSNARNEHHATVHLKVKRHRCPHCTETFRNYFQRNKHISSVHGLKLKEFKCAMCPKIFSLSGKLGVHVRTVHLKVKRHACEVCEWKFYSKSELKDHMIRHGGERKFQCTVCKKAYARKYTLREHMRIHENDRRFVCTVCGRSFVQNCSLKHHTKIHHPNEIVKADSYVK